MSQVTRGAVWLLAATTLGLAGLAAQSRRDGAPALPDDRPLQCWWRASSGAIRVGEVVDVTLTCAALETDAMTAVPDESRLTVAAVQLSPFEIVDGSHPPDVREGNRRFLQYRYRLRIISPDVIGRDVKLPPLGIPYRVQSRVGADATLTGRDHVHQMPQLVFRVVSQVPADADDIRDSSDASLAEIEALRFRARAYNLAAWVLGALGLVALASTVVPAVGLLRRTRLVVARRTSDRVVLQHVARVLGERLDGARGAGWTAEALAEAHVAARIVGAIACGTGAREVAVERGAPIPEGRLTVRRRFGRQVAAVTTHVTVEHLARALEQLPPDAPGGARARLERLRDALGVLTRAQYGAGERSDWSAVDDAIASARDIGIEMARERLTSPREWFRRAPTTAAAAPEF